MRDVGQSDSDSDSVKVKKTCKKMEESKERKRKKGMQQMGEIDTECKVMRNGNAWSV